MRIMCVGAFVPVKYCGKKVPNQLSEDSKIVAAAKKELENIKTQGQQAGTDAAWWRGEFSEAKAALEAIVNEGSVLAPAAERSSLASFHDFNDDGFI